MNNADVNSFAIYRLPGESLCTLIQQEGEPQALRSLADLNGRSGFVMAPFVQTAESPLLLLSAAQRTVCPVDRLSDNLLPAACRYSSRETGGETTRQHYAIDFANFHAQLLEGRFQKLVLARSAFLQAPLKEPVALFRHACQAYPDAFVALISTPQSGTWLMATPEVLVEGETDRWHTMALAGTMEVAGPWSVKNIREQRYVTTYIMKCLERFASDIREEGPVTVQAANVVHLRSDFCFTFDDPTLIGNLLQTLHPTPAVGGLPKDEAVDFIVHNEASARRYYSGFAGPLQIEGATHLFVALRCMQLLSDGYRLYAGGGLLPDSEEATEWHETEAMMQAMKRLVEG